MGIVEYARLAVDIRLWKWLASSSFRLWEWLYSRVLQLVQLSLTAWQLCLTFVQLCLTVYGNG
jgi:hypothetical protein